jgi:hypothetical protein
MPDIHIGTKNGNVLIYFAFFVIAFGSIMRTVPESKNMAQLNTNRQIPNRGFVPFL